MMGSLDTSSSWVIVVLASAIILFFLCLVICLIRDDLNVMRKRKNGEGVNNDSPRRKSPTKIKKGKKYEQCDEANISDSSISEFHEDYDSQVSSVSDEEPGQEKEFVGGGGRDSETRDSMYDPQYWRHRTSNTLRLLKLI